MSESHLGSGNNGPAMRKRWSPWLKRIALLECAALVLAMVGPGFRGAARRSDGRQFARWFIDDPTWLDSVLVNFLVVNVFFAAIFLATRVAVLRRERRSRRRSR